MHVVADAVTSIFAIIALIFGKYLGWDFLDAALGSWDQYW
jgi:Co/Zn/Cd efflux system component